MTIREARGFAEVWKNKLGLSNIKLEVRRPKPNEMEGKDHVAEAYWKPEFQHARILLRKDANIHDIVHELLHCRLEGHQPTPREYDPLYERAINALVDALIGYPEPGSLT